MHLPLYIPPDKPARFPWQWTLAALLMLSWGSMAERRVLPSAPIPDCECQTCQPPSRVVDAAEPSPVKWVTVTTVTEYSGGGGCGHFSLTTHKMPLMELYDELCAVEDTADEEAQVESCPMTDELREQTYLRAEKKFMQKYGLTPEQVMMIKREGYRTTHPKPEARSGEE